jgi:glycerol-3-phosphate acyltransferase PlsY
MISAADKFFFVYVLGSYLMGSIPTGYWLGKIWQGIDVRQYGSGNLGATNVFRVLGAGAGSITLVIDILKGFFPVFIYKSAFVGARMHCIPNDPACFALNPGETTALILIGFATIIGHTASIFVRFRGGKGIATSAGVFLALLPIPTAAAIAVFALTFSLTRYVSASSLLAAYTLVASSFALAMPRPLSWTAAAIAAFVTWTHRTNIQRLLNGTENRISWSKKNA